MKFNQQDTCCKCGYVGHKVDYKVQWTGTPPERKKEDWLQLTCTRCGFSWCRDCLDAGEGKDLYPTIGCKG